MRKRVALALIVLLVTAWAIAEFRFRESAGWDGDLPVSAGADRDDQAGRYRGDMLPTKEDAIAAAEMYFNRLFRTGGFESYAVRSVFFDAEDGVWVVGLREGAGAGFEIALRKSDGAVLTCRGTE